MLTCEHCRERLFDLVYGLLEGTELQETQAHVDACADCQAALTKVKTSQKLMARAAKAITQVPEFALPQEQPAHVATPSTVLAPPEMNPRRKRSLWRKPWVAWVIAASVLFVVGAPVVWYRNAQHRLQTDVAAARQKSKMIEGELAGLPARYQPKEELALKSAREKASPYLHVVGPKTMQPNSKAHLEITTRHPEGELAPCTLHIKLCDAKTGQLCKIERAESQGRLRVMIDAAGAKPGSVLQLHVEAETKFGKSPVDEKIQVQAPTFVTRIDTNKLLYQAGDVVFFRVLVLDRSTLTPPSQPVNVRVSLIHEKRKLRTLERTTGPGGILAAEFAVEEDYPEGSYTLEIAAADEAKTLVQSASQSLEFVRELPGIRLDQNRYAPGSIVTGDLVVPGDQEVPKKIVGQLDGKPIPITLQPQAMMSRATAPGGGGFGTPGGPKGGGKGASADRFYRFATPPLPAAPPTANAMKLTVPLPDVDKKKQAIDAVIPLTPTDFAIDFFPEGGDLVAGIQNRVFYRVRSKSGGPYNGDGKVILMTDTNNVVDTQYHLGMGYFDFTPSLKENYSVRITTPAKVENVPAPFASLGIRTSGVVLQVSDPCEEHAPKAVGKQGDPIHVTVRHKGPPTKLLLVAHCRGQIVDQRWIEVRKNDVDVTLEPTPETQGMIRVTAYELIGDALEPIAERLVYRAATQRLDLGFTPDRDRFLPMQMTTAKVHSRDEAEKSAAAWILASVVDERFQTKPRSLSSHFLLLNEIRTGPEFENAQIVLADAPESVQVLERFLGTNGWRRYVAADAPGIVPAVNVNEALVFSKENMPLEMLQKIYQEKIDQTLKPIRAEEIAAKLQLEGDSERATAALNILTGQLHTFETQVQLWIRLGLGGALAALLVAGIVLMGVGVYRSLRARKSATPMFGSATACLAACMGIVLIGTYLGQLDNNEQVRDAAPQANLGNHEPLAKAGNVEPVAPPAVNHAPWAQIPAGEFAVRANKKMADQEIMAAHTNKSDDGAKREMTKALQADLVMNVTRGREDSPAVSMRRVETPENENLRDWFNRSRGGAAYQDTKPAPQKAKTAKVPESKKSTRQLEYPYQQAPNLTGDTLLWHPTLYLANGAGEVRFAMPAGEATTYRVLLFGHDATGRFGFFETRLDVPAFSGR